VGCACRSEGGVSGIVRCIDAKLVEELELPGIEVGKVIETKINGVGVIDHQALCGIVVTAAACGWSKRMELHLDEIIAGRLTLSQDRQRSDAVRRSGNVGGFCKVRAKRKAAGAESRSDARNSRETVSRIKAGCVRVGSVQEAELAAEAGSAREVLRVGA
jgi:hypothetical protein